MKMLKSEVFDCLARQRVGPVDAFWGVFRFGRDAEKVEKVGQLEDLLGKEQNVFGKGRGDKWMQMKFYRSNK
jgi:hypothetical protein